MFAKVFEQIFDSSISEDYELRHIFMDLLVLADSDGVLDMTAEALSRRTNIPLKAIKKAIQVLCEPDGQSRSKTDEGRRLKPLDSKREWGWIIVNYGHYRDVRDEDARRAYFRDYMRERRKRVKSVKLCKKVLSPSTNAEAEGEGATKISKKEGVQAGQDLVRSLEKGISNKEPVSEIF